MIEKIDKIKFMSYEFTVEWIKGFIDDTENNQKALAGCLISAKNKIKLDNDVPYKYESLLHELIHLVCIIFDIKLDESQVSRLSEGLYHMLKENPWVSEAINNNNNKKYEPSEAIKRLKGAIND